MNRIKNVLSEYHTVYILHTIIYVLFLPPSGYYLLLNKTPQYLIIHDYNFLCLLQIRESENMRGESWGEGKKMNECKMEKTKFVTITSVPVED